MDNYTIYHIHSDLSNLTAGSGADSVTKYNQYLDKAEQLGMNAIAFSEHGSVLNHINKKHDVEERGMKYIHANEIYLTKGLVDVNGEPLRERDNYHYLIMAKNYEGYLELNKLTSQSFNKEDGHFYFNPRITFDELKNTSDNILMTSACIASPIYRLYQESLNGNKNSERELDDLLNFMGDNKHRMFFEIQPHNHPKQIEFNQLLLRLSKDLDVPLIGGTDTHALNKEHAEARSLFIKSKGINYGDEDSFDLTFKSYEEFVKMFEEQNALPRNVYLEAIHNTNIMADMVEPFSLDDSPKYPKLYDKPVEVFKEKINEGTIKRGIDKLPKDEKKVYFDRIKEEFKTYEKLESIEYMLLQKHIIDWANENGIEHGYGRGCFLPDTKITMADGSRKSIQDVKIGDEVITHLGNIKRVKDTMEYDCDEEIAVLKTFNNETLKCTKDHEIFSVDTFICPKDKRSDVICKKTCSQYDSCKVSQAEYIPEWREAKSLKPMDYVVTPVIKKDNQNYEKIIDIKDYDSTSCYDDSRVWYEIGTNKFVPKRVNRFIDVYSDDFIKFAGLFIGQGWTKGNQYSSGIAHHSEKTELIKETKEIVDRIFGINSTIKYHKSKNVCLIIFDSKIISLFLKDYFGDKALNKSIPKDLFIMDKNKNDLLLKYLWVGDGSVINQSSKKTSYSTISENLASQVYHVLNKSNYIPSFIVNKKRKINWNAEYKVSLSGKQLERFNEEILKGTDKECFNLSVKYNRNYRDDNYLYKKVKSVNFEHYKGKVYDLSVEDDTSYIAENIAVHNSVNGSLIAYLLGITEMDSVKHVLNFFRFLNPNRISLPDIDVDFPPNRRQEVIDFIATIDGVDFSEIITFNTFALKGAIREVGRFLDMPLQEVDMISKSVETYNGKDHIDESYKKRYPELFKYVDLMVGVIFAMGSHPSGFVVSPVNLDETVSTLYTKDSKYKVSAVDMGELDSKNFVKLDVLGLMNIELINETCKIAGIERLTPDNVDINDIDVWKSMSESTLGVFQMESDSAQRYVKQLFSQETLDNIHNINPNASYIDLLSMANGAIRPSGNSYRYELSQGIMKDNGHDALNEFLKPTLGFLIFQEQIMEFLTKFANHTGSESDTVRRGLSKKKGTQQYLDKIRQGFSEFMKSEYNEKQEIIDKIIEPFLNVISDASGYGFSDNHSKPYSYTGYIGAYLRHHYPLEFLTTALNLQDDDKEQTGKIINYAKSKKITIKPVEFGKSGSSYRYNKDENAIYKGIASIKYLNSNVARELLDLEKTTSYEQSEFHLLVRDLIEKTSLNTRQAEILIRLDFFKRFGKKEILLEIYLTMTDKKKPNTLKYEKFKDVVQKNIKVNKRTGEEKLTLKTIKKPVVYKNNLVDKTKEKRLENAKEYEEAVRENPPTKIELYEQIQFEKDNLGYAVSAFPELPDNVALVTEINKKFTPLVTFYILNNGDEKLLKVKKKDFWSDDIDKLFVGDIVQIKSEFEEAGWRHLDGKFVRDENKIDKFLGNCRIIRPSKKRKS